MNSEVTYFPKEDILKAVEKLETPFFLYEERKLRENLANFRDSFTVHFPNCWPLFAVKANMNPHLLEIIKSEGFGSDCSSPSEAYISHKLGMKGMYTGNYTTRDEFEYIMDKDVILNLDDISMIETLAELGMPETVSLRINPGTDESDALCATSGPDAKYGVPIEKAAEAYSLLKAKGVKHFGIHIMTGSNVPTGKSTYFREVTETLFSVIAEVKDKTEIEIEMMNIGGGFGVPYHPDEESLDMKMIATSIRTAFDEQCAKYQLKEPRLLLEPGRWILANAGWLIAKVHVIKDSYKKFIGIDASANDMPRPSIYGAYHHISVLPKSGQPERSEKETVSVVGRICENNDQFAKDRELSRIEIGDTLVIHNCGAHAFAMGHNYNGRPRNAEYLIPQNPQNSEIKQIRNAETIEDLFSKITDQ